MGLGDGFDPRALGARCDACVLQRCRPVPPERNPQAEFAVIGDYPSDDDERNGVLFSGAAGKLLMRAFRGALTDRKHMHLTNVLLCRPPAGDLQKVLAVITKENQGRESRNKKLRQQYEQLRKSQPWMEEPTYEDPLPTPQECCEPRLLAEVRRFTQFVSLGALALRFAGNTKASVMAIRGGMTELASTGGLPERKLMPTVHPSFVLHAGRYLRVFFTDIERAVRWFRGGLQWKKTEITYHPKAAELHAFLNTPAEYFTFDLETDGIEPLTAKIRCVGIWRPDNRAVVVGTLGKDGARQFYTEPELEAVKRVLTAFFENENIAKVAHNSPYDNTVLLQQWQTKAVPVIDTILLHRLVESELPHNLGFVGSLYTDAPSWKTDREGRKIAFDAETDEQLHEYCALDCQVTGQVLPRLLSSVQIRNQSQLIPIDHAVQRACLDMHRVGFWINQEKRAKAEKKYIEIVTKTMGELRRISGIPDYNPGSPIQTRGILFGTWRLVAPLKEEERYTESGLESINDFVLRALLTTRLTEQQKAFIMTLRRYRKAMKLLGTYIVKLRYSNQVADIGWDDEEDPEERQLRIEMKDRYGIERMGIVDVRTGRMYPGFSAHVPVTGRLASSKPINCFDSSTEVLTERGWMAFDQLERGIRLAQWDDRTDEISWAVPTAYHERDYTGDMVLFENTSASLFCTPEHRIPLQKTSKRRITVEASFLLNPPAGHQTMHAGHCGWGAGLDLSRAELQFMLAWQADGSEVMTGGSVFGVDFTFTKERKAERLHSILTDMGVPFTYTKRDHKHRFYVSRCATTDKIRDMLGVTESGQRTHKTFGPWLLNMSSDQAQVFREEIWHWDGCLGEKSQYASTQKCNADWVQTVLTLSGVRANVRLYTNSEGNSVYVVDTKWSAVNAVTPRALRERVPFSGKVYCVTMPKDSIIIRRKGKVMITRQCQNFPKFLRALAEPFAGHCYIGADADQLELRIAAALWGAQKYLRAFDAGADPHSTTAYGIFGERFQRAEGFPGGRWDGDLFIPDGTGKWSGDAKNYRDLAKKVQYACVAPDTQVVTTGPEGQKAIQDLVPGDVLWAWSRTRNRYEPAPVVRAWKTGVRRTIKVNLRWWGGPRAGWREATEVVTPDHLFLLRDGTFRAAGNLKPNDRLMPFWRRVKHDGYRLVRALNTGEYMAEHRVLAGIYETNTNDNHIHHEDEVKTNNDAANLAEVSPEAHYEIHKEDIARGRRRSEVWRKSVQNTEVRRAATQKSWDSGTRKKAVFSSVLDQHRDKIGVLPDAEVAALAGCTPENVGIFRRKLGISAVTNRGKVKESLLLVREKLSVLTDTEIAAMIGCDRKSVFNLRKELNIQPPTRSVGYQNTGGESDAEGDNHIVSSVEEHETMDVWDVEVAHEDHNFALASGIFVHNSQYKANVDTVHRVIAQTEVENSDGTTSLPFLTLPLSDVRQMHEAWLSAVPEFSRGWDREVNEWRAQGYLEEPVSGRRRDFLDGENPNELVNFKVQGAAASLMNKAMIALHQEYSAHCHGYGTGLNSQVHDAMTIEVPLDGATFVANPDKPGDGHWDVPKGSIPWRCMNAVNEAMNQTHVNLPGVKITAAADIGKSWKEVG